MPGLKDTRLVLSDGKSIDIDSRYSEIIISENGSYSINSVNIESSAHEGYSRVIVPERHWVHLVLPDGSRVDLNSSSDFIFPSAFSEKERRVHVCGEGYFSVVKDASRPFTVSADGMKVSVLGTEFNMKSRDNLSVLSVRRISTLSPSLSKLTGAVNAIVLSTLSSSSRRSIFPLMTMSLIRITSRL